MYGGAGVCVKRNPFPGIALGALSLTLGFLLAEAALHILNIPREQTSHQQLFVEYDSLLGWRNIPNGTGTISSDEYVRRLTYNERSMRGPVLQYEKPAGTLRVLLLGDSFVDGYTENYGDRVSEVLERDLETGTGLQVEVIPMGTGGFSTDQELLWLRSEGLKYDPDVVVLMFHPNDVWYSISERYWRGSKPRFVIDGGALRLTNVPVPPPDSAEDRSVSLGRRANRWIRENSKIYWLVARAAQNNPRFYGMAVRLGLTTPSPEMVFDAKSGTVVAGEFSVFAASPPPETREAWRVTRELIRAMREETRATGAEFLTFLIPVRSRIYTQFDDVRIGLGAGNADIDVDAVVRQFDSMCITHSLPYIDPTTAFLTAADSLAALNQRLYYRYDWHWNAKGHELAGQLLARYVRPLLRERQLHGEAGGFSSAVRQTCGSLTPPIGFIH